MTERLKTVETTETLFVGVGGIGSDIVAKVAAMCKGNELKNIRFAVLDTDANSLKTVEGNGAKITKVQTSSSQTVKEYLDKDDNARLYWFPNNATLYGKTVSEGAGQVRAISRLALNNAIRTGEINKLYKEIDNLLLKDSGNFKQALRVVVVSSATGGTGSGMAMITAMLIREYLHDHYREKKAIVRGFFVLPSVMDTVIDSQMERNSQYRNGYATLKEINAFMMIGSGFGETEDELKRYKDIHISVPTPTGESRKLNCLPFDFCFLLEAADKNAEGMDSLEKYKCAAALSIYEQNIGPMQKRSFSLEDNIVKEFSAKNKFGRNRFGGIGASKIVYPYEDIMAYMTYDRTLSRIGKAEANNNAEEGTIDEAIDWYKYDREFEREYKKYDKDPNASASSKPHIETSYVDAVDRDVAGKFGKEIHRDLGETDEKTASKVIDEKVKKYLEATERYIVNKYKTLDSGYADLENWSSDAIINASDKNGEALQGVEDIAKYGKDFGYLGLRRAKNEIRTLLYSAPRITSEEVQKYNLEYLLKNNENVVHPISARYILYKLKIAIEEKKTKNAGKINEIAKEIDDAVSGEANIENDVTLLGKHSKQDDWISIGDRIAELAENQMEHVNRQMYELLYEELLVYVKDLCGQYKKLFTRFQSKSIDLLRRKQEILDKLLNEKGRSEFYLCSNGEEGKYETKDKLDELASRIPQSEHGFLLPSDSSAEIFESVKKNVEIDKKNEFDLYKQPLIDIFENDIVTYFEKEVREDSKDLLDVNVVQAFMLDREIEKCLENKLYGNGDAIASRLTPAQKQTCLEEMMRIGMKLATPGVNGQSFVEPRDVKICTYNESVDDMRDIHLDSATAVRKIQSVPSDTVSKYEMRFFNAIYNITPDDIPLFKGPKKDKITGETDHYSEGIYYKAYQEYGKNIGPDSMKSATISTHIDKRWDAIVCLPELNFDVQYNQMVRAHSALLYGLIFGLIRKFKSSRYDMDKKVFKVVDEEGGRIDLIVSNGTECDEFYEVLDALYRDKSSTNIIMEVAEEYSRTDVEKNNNYMQSAFFEFVTDLRLPEGHKTPTSIFEIPLLYYNSLPSSLADNNELSIMIDSVIHIIEKAVNRHEKEQDRSAHLCQILEHQYRVFIESFNNDSYNLKKNTEVYDNIVVSMVCTKIINKFKELEVSNCGERIRKLRDTITEKFDEE